MKHSRYSVAEPSVCENRYHDVRVSSTFLLAIRSSSNDEARSTGRGIVRSARRRRRRRVSRVLIRSYR